ncbi:Lrp/AsnC family transcriptional regulator [Candidatus Woesearchaeota archaeon]|nr:Lrp/AsnC family transcriptional regulator [Candidatus Woesearchaeota archaeon]MCF8012997.1 Lrp/AsnC family transcriptional regulator [Candidatus Woesearchaeota archaeon]
MLDAKDKKIVSELLLNSRKPVSQIAKSVALSREVTLYRIKKLEKSLIKHYFTTINFEALGFKRFICFIQLKGITVEEENKFLEYLTKHKFVTYLGPTIGKWNMVLDVVAKNDEHLKDILSEIKNEAKDYFESYIVNGTAMDVEIYPTKLVGIKSRIEKKEKEIKYKMDQIDKKILLILSINSKAEYKDLSKKLKLSANAIKYRIKSMEKANIIEGYTTSLDFKQIGEFYNIQLKLSSIYEKKLIAYIRNHENTLFYYKYFGNENWDIDIGFIGKDSKEFRKFLLEFKEVFGSHIKIHDMYIITDVVKDNVAPEGIFE